MAIPTIPTLDTLTVDALKLAGYPAAAAGDTEQLLAETWMEELKNELWLKSKKKLKSLQTENIFVITDGERKIICPSDYASFIGVDVLECTHYGVCQGGITWTSRTSGTTNGLYAATYGNSLFVVVGWAQTILTSSDGTTWTLQTVGVSNLYDIIYDNSIFVTVGATGTIQTSSDGSTWTSRTSGTTNGLQGIAYGNSVFVTVGEAGTILTSSDGTTWISRTSGVSVNLRAISYVNNLFIAVGDSGNILMSLDGITWASRTSGTTENLYGIAYGNSLFVAVGATGTILSSSDGITWTSRTSGTTNFIYGITYENNLFVTVGAAGETLKSSDGSTWTSVSSGTTEILRNVFYGNSLTIAIGDSGTILTSADSATTTTAILSSDEDADSAQIGQEIIIYLTSDKKTAYSSYITAINTTTKVVTFSPAIVASADATYSYMIVDEKTELDEKHISQMTEDVSRGDPENFFSGGEIHNTDTSNKYSARQDVYYLAPVPYRTDGKPWAIRERYFADLTKLDITEGATTIISKIYREWRYMWIEGIKWKAWVHGNDKRQVASEAAWDRAMRNIISIETLGFDMSNLQGTVET